MGFLEENGNSEVYKNLTKPDNTKINQRWTLYLVFCCMTISLGSFQFGYNIGSTNLVTPILKHYFEKAYFKELYFDNLAKFRAGEKKYIAGIQKYNNGTDLYNEKMKQLVSGKEKRLKYLDLMFSMNQTAIAIAKKEKEEKTIEIREKYNMTVEDFLSGYAQELLRNGLKRIKDGGKKLDAALPRLLDARQRLTKGRKKLDFFGIILWGVTNSLFIIGGLVGALISKYVMDHFGRKKGILFHYSFAVIGSVLLFMPELLPHLSKVGPVLVKLGRFFQGIQGGMTCSIIPTYLSEIAPSDLRGQTVIIHNLFLTLGVVTAQFLGFDFLLGQYSNWTYLLSFPILPAILGGVLLLVFFDESPKFLLFERSDEGSAIRALQKLRDTVNVSNELTKMYVEGAEMSSERNMSITDVLIAPELRRPLITGILLQFAQQFCGMNAVFFYSRSIMERAGVNPDYVQTGVLLTGLANALCTFCCMKLVDRLGRKPLLLGSMSLMALDLTFLTIFLRFSSYNICAVLALVCLVGFIITFAIGLGPIPFIFITETFKHNSRSSAMSICVFFNWFFNLFLILMFPLVLHLLSGYIFIIFIVTIVAVSGYVQKFMPETKGRSADEIQNIFNKKNKLDSQYELKNNEVQA